MNQYHTYTWALVPEGHTDGNSTNCCVVFRGKTTVRLTDSPWDGLQSSASSLLNSCKGTHCYCGKMVINKAPRRSTHICTSIFVRTFDGKMHSLASYPPTVPLTIAAKCLTLSPTTANREQPAQELENRS